MRSKTNSEDLITIASLFHLIQNASCQSQFLIFSFSLSFFHLDVLESESKIPQTVATNIVSNTPSYNVTTVLSTPSDDDWELVSGPGSAEEGQEETKEEAVGHEDMPSTVERDLIDQIRCMFVRDSGRQASAVEEREWLKSIRDVTEPDDETEEEE